MVVYRHAIDRSLFEILDAVEGANATEIVSKIENKLSLMSEGKPRSARFPVV